MQCGLNRMKFMRSHIFTPVLHIFIFTTSKVARSRFCRKTIIISGRDMKNFGCSLRVTTGSFFSGHFL